MHGLMREGWSMRPAFPTPEYSYLERRCMTTSKKTGYKAYAAAPFMMIVLYSLASLSFWLIFKDTATVVFFILLAVIFITSMSVYAVVPIKAKNAIRITNIFLISLLLFGLACIAGRQNFQIEGFFFYLLTGTFGGVMVHFLVGKIVGPLLTGRTWCSWGCWTLMILDLLPFKKGSGWKQGNIAKLKYVHLLLSLALVAVMVYIFKYVLHDPNQSPDQPGPLKAMYWFLIGNGFYYVSGIALAIPLKDNRAFCKYLCPVSVLLKFSNLFSILRIKGDKEKCVRCNTCVEQCPFHIDIPKYLEQGTRIKSSECVMCMKCVAACPESALCSSLGFDGVTRDYLKNNN
jgi:polyferredoxin